MTTLAEALEVEHQVVDKGLEDFAVAVGQGNADSSEILKAFDLLRRHIYVEEEYLFGPMRDQGGLMMPVMVMLNEHGEIWRLMDAMEEMIEDDADAADLIAACQELLDTLERHNSKEEPIIYPEVANVLTEAESAELLEFLENGEMPEDWLCEKI